MLKLSSVKDFLKGLAPFLVCLCAIANFFVSCSVSRAVRPQFVYSVVTNFVVSSNLSTSAAPVSVYSVGSVLPTVEGKAPRVDPLFEEVKIEYHAFVERGRACFRWLDHDYRVGDATSYGIVVGIYPDRILLHNGNRLVNLKGLKGVKDGSNRSNSNSPQLF